MPTLWKLIPTVALLAALVAALTVRPPRHPISGRDLIRLVIAVSVLYLSGGVALLAHRSQLAGVSFGTGLALCALALWLSRGAPPPRDDDDEGEQPPVSPPPDIDWSYYEDQFRQPAGRH